MEGMKPLDAEALRIKAEQLSHRAKFEQHTHLPHIIENLRTEAIGAYKTLGDHYSSVGDAKNAKRMYKLMRTEQNALNKFLRTSKPSTSGHVPSGN